jgi:hypothetical protein
VTVRANQGVTADEFLQGFQRAMRQVWFSAREIADELGVDPRVLLDASPGWHDLETEAMTQAAAAYRRLEAERAHADQQRRSRLLHDILRGRPADSHLRSDGTYFTVRARTTDGASLADLERALNARGDGLVGLAAGDLAGLVAQKPTHAPPGVAIGVGPPVTLGDIPDSYRQATRAVETAVAFDLTGVFTLDDLRVDAAVMNDTDIGERLAARYLAPLDALGEFGRELQETLAVYLDNGKRLAHTAELLHVHRNTLKYRLARIEEVTGADLDRTQDTVELWWAVRRRAADRKQRQG